MSRTFFSIIFVLGALVIGLFYVWPQWSQFSDMSVTIDNLTAVSKQYDDLIKNRDALLASINSISKENLDRLDQALPLGAHASEFLVALESYTVGNGVALKRVDLASPAQDTTQQSSGPIVSSSSVRTAQNPTPFQPRQQQVMLANLAPGAQKEIGDLPFSIEVSGSYESLKKFLAGLEHNLRLVDVSEIGFSAPEKATDPIDVTLKAKTYYQ